MTTHNAHAVVVVPTTLNAVVVTLLLSFSLTPSPRSAVQVVRLSLITRSALAVNRTVKANQLVKASPVKAVKVKAEIKEAIKKLPELKNSTKIVKYYNCMLMYIDIDNHRNIIVTTHSADLNSLAMN